MCITFRPLSVSKQFRTDRWPLCSSRSCTPSHVSPWASRRSHLAGVSSSCHPCVTGSFFLLFCFGNFEIITNLDVGRSARPACSWCDSIIWRVHTVTGMNFVSYLYFNWIDFFSHLRYSPIHARWQRCLWAMKWNALKRFFQCDITYWMTSHFNNAY